MLLNLREYHRPSGDLARVLELLERQQLHTVPLAGGDSLIGSADEAVEAVVDLQDAGLDTLARSPDGSIEIGAMVTRTVLAEHADVVLVYGGIIAVGARLWGGNVQRNRATVGGAIAAAASNDPLVAALLACDAEVLLYGAQGPASVPIAEHLQGDPRGAGRQLITGVRVPAPRGATGAALATVGRTPKDAPIVLAAAVVAIDGGRCVSARLSLGGVAEKPIRMQQVEAALEGRPAEAGPIEAAAQGCASVQPTGDFRGSAEYRQAMAVVLARRALTLAAADAR